MTPIISLLIADSGSKNLGGLNLVKIPLTKNFSMWHVKFSEATKNSPKTIVLIQGRTRMSQSPLSSILKTLIRVNFTLAKAMLIMRCCVYRKRLKQMAKCLAACNVYFCLHIDKHETLIKYVK